MADRHRSKNKKILLAVAIIAVALLIGAGLDANTELSYVFIDAPDSFTPADSRININTASEDELCELDGIGSSIASLIVEYRTATPFSSVEELKNIRGIGEKKFDAIKDRIKTDD